MELYNIDYIPGKEFKALGLVKGNTITSKNFVKDIGAGLKTIIGGELRSYTKMLEEAREVATTRLIKEAKELEADAIINVRYGTSAVAQGAAEIIVYGTAVKFL